MWLLTITLLQLTTVTHRTRTNTPGVAVGTCSPFHCATPGGRCCSSRAAFWGSLPQTHRWTFILSVHLSMALVRLRLFVFHAHFCPWKCISPNLLAWSILWLSFVSFDQFQKCTLQLWLMWLVGLGVWFSLWVWEVPGSILGRDFSSVFNSVHGIVGVTKCILIGYRIIIAIPHTRKYSRQAYWCIVQLPSPCKYGIIWNKTSWDLEANTTRHAEIQWGVCKFHTLDNVVLIYWFLPRFHGVLWRTLDFWSSDLRS